MTDRRIVAILFIIYALNWEHSRSQGTEIYVADFHNNTIIENIAFGSCSHSKKPQPLWPYISYHKPDVWIWLGDVVYADTKIAPLTWTPSPLVEMAAKYKAQRDRADYKEFLESGIQVLGVWDDHDFGINGGGKRYKDRLQSQGMFLDFLAEPVDSPRRTREGTYVSYMYGHGDRTVKVILLDTRSHSVKGDNCDILGQEQWQWLEKQLSDPKPPQVTLIGSGIQVLADVPLTDKWQTCPTSYDRLIWMVQNTPRVFFISGDVHVGEFMCLNNTSTGYPLYEMTSSGMTATCVSWISKRFCRWLVTEIAVSTTRTHDIITAINYGLINIHWDEEPVSISMSIYGEKGTLLQQRIPFRHLEKMGDGPKCPPPAPRPSSLLKYGFYVLVCSFIGIIILGFVRLLIALVKPLLFYLLFPMLGVYINADSTTKVEKSYKSMKED